ncbi:M16 family metallopeptidase [Mesorhizobium sp. ZC-5]|uniref:M16 family metallopeptidase n=1 Tax=Mesorhizobium sp. ZC-5 TaxID=2986066 RepID=UPI0021E76ACF|nr:pitrilysin family protein [Mesorhizobium sp. ZC-5]MCV3242276.1 insulinase family protein [Mesorhizobium sp. ZC-5]
MPNRSQLLTAVATLFLAIVFLTLPAIVAARAAVTIQEVTSEKGIKAWLVEDYSVPIVSVRFAFSGGSTQDPAGKEGLANLMTGLFDEGADNLDSDAFQERLDDAGAEMRFNAGRDSLYGSMRMLADQKDEALELLRLAVEKPRFDAAPIDRIRAQIVSGIVANEKDPQTAAQFAWAQALYGEHPYSRRDEGTRETLAAITADDLHAFHKRLFARGNLTIGVVGAIDAETLKRDLDKVFGDLPAEPALQKVEMVEPKLDQEILIPYDLPQTSLLLAYPGIERTDPQFFAAYLMNHILGGGSFTSRLFNEVREKRGLAYGVDSSIVNNEHSSALVINTATRSDRSAETLAIIRAEVKRMADEGVTEEELDAAKKYLIGSYAINNLDTSRGIAGTLVELQINKLGIDYIERRKGLIDAVTADQVQAAAKRLLLAEPAVLIIGPAQAKGDKG